MAEDGAHRNNLKLNSYSNLAISGNPEVWLARFNRQADRHQWEDIEKIDSVSSYLAGEALEFYNHELTIDTTFEEFSVALIRHFSNQPHLRVIYDGIDYNKSDGMLKFIEEKTTAARRADIATSKLVDDLYQKIPSEIKVINLTEMPNTGNADTDLSILRSRAIRGEQLNNEMNKKKYAESGNFKPNSFNSYKRKRNSYDDQPSAKHSKREEYCTFCEIEKGRKMTNHTIENCHVYKRMKQNAAAQVAFQNKKGKDRPAKKANRVVRQPPRDEANDERQDVNNDN